MIKAALLVSLLAAVASAFAPLATHQVRSTALNAYVPDGFKNAAEWKAFQNKEKAKSEKKNLGRMGPKGFKSRSFQSFHEALERGEAEHLLPVENAKARIKKGELKLEDIPYMQRGGSWDDSDVKGAKKRKWLASDKEYASGGFKKEQSVSIFGYGEGLDWTGRKSRSGPSETVVGRAPKFAKNYKPPNVKDIKSGKDEPKKKGFFGLF